jgi:hypothetical protein
VKSLLRDEKEGSPSTKCFPSEDDEVVGERKTAFFS